MRENEARLLFKARRANSLAILRFMSAEGLLSHKSHFDLWRQVTRASTRDELDQAVAEVQEVFQQKGGQVCR